MTAKIETDKLFFTSDTHFFHTGMLLGGCQRPFHTVEQMNEKLIRNWNSVVPQGNSTVFHLGDLSFGRSIETVGVLSQLNGRIILIKGNHDKKLAPAIKQRFGHIQDYYEIDALYPGGTKQRICMMHFALRTWNRHHYGSWHLHGHSHGSLPPLGRSMDVGVDTNNFFPYTFDEVQLRLLAQPLHSNDHHKVPE